MPTKCLIGIKRENGMIESISCQYDGYIQGGTGAILFGYYQDDMKVKELINLGNICVLKKHPRSLTHQGDSDCLAEDVTVAYARDYGMEYQEAIVFKNSDDFSRYYNHSWCDYAYLYDESQKRWSYVHGNVTQENVFQPLKNAVYQIEVNQIQGMKMS